MTNINTLILLSLSLTKEIINICSALKLPENENEGCTFDRQSYIVQPDPNDCRTRGGSYCCNQLYLKDIQSKKEREWKNFLARKEDDRLAALENPPRQRRWKYPLREPRQIDIAHLDIFEATVHEVTTSTRPSSRKLRIDSFHIYCWITIPDEELYSLFIDDYSKANWARILTNDKLRKSHMFKVVCNVKERVQLVPLPTKRDWHQKSKKLNLVNNEDVLMDAKCIEVSDEAWSAFQQSFWQIKRDPESKMRRRSELRQQGLNVMRIYSHKMTGPGMTNTCLQFPTLEDNLASPQDPAQALHPELLVLGSDDMLAAAENDRLHNTTNGIAKSKVIYAAGVCASRSPGPLENERSLYHHSEESGEYIQSDSEALRSIQHLDSTGIGSGQYADYADTLCAAEPTVVDWSIPPVIQSIKLVSREHQDRAGTVIASSLGPSNYLATALPASTTAGAHSDYPSEQQSNNAENPFSGNNHEHHSLSSLTSSAQLQLDLEACFATMPDTPGITFWSEVLKILGPGEAPAAGPNEPGN